MHTPFILFIYFLEKIANIANMYPKRYTAHLPDIVTKGTYAHEQNEDTSINLLYMVFLFLLLLKYIHKN